jgi:RimJ/RimL family protein N-acetyltransferase
MSTCSAPERRWQYEILLEDLVVGQFEVFDAYHSVAFPYETFVYVPPEFRRKGAAGGAYTMWLQDWQADGPVHAVVHNDNDASLAFHRNYGFVQIRQHHDYQIFLIVPTVSSCNATPYKLRLVRFAVNWRNMHGHDGQTAPVIGVGRNCKQDGTEV